MRFKRACMPPPFQSEWIDERLGKYDFWRPCPKDVTPVSAPVPVPVQAEPSPKKFSPVGVNGIEDDIEEPARELTVIDGEVTEEPHLLIEAGVDDPEDESGEDDVFAAVSGNEEEP